MSPPSWSSSLSSPDPLEPVIVDDAPAFLEWLQANTTGPYGVDTETVGVDPTEESPVGRGKIVCWSLAWVDPTLGTHPERRTPLARSAFLWESSLEPFMGWLTGSSVVGHNVFSFDRHVFANHGITLGGVHADTLRMAKLLDANSKDNDLKSWMGRAFGYTPVGDYEELFSHRKCLGTEDYGDGRRPSYRKVGEVPRVPTVVGGNASRLGAGRQLIPLDRVRTDFPHLLPTLQRYAALDAKATLELYFLLRRRLEGTPWKGLGQEGTWGNLWEFYERFWNPSLYTLNEIERNGIRYNAELAVTGAATAQLAADAAAQRAYKYIGKEINLDSPPQLGQFLYGEKFFEIPPVTGTIKAIKANHEYKPTTSEAALRHIAIENPEDAPGIEAILENRKLTDLIQFLAKLPGLCDTDGRLHTILKPDTRTGRLSSSKPNLQNIPKDDTYGLRSAFVAAPGHRLIVADYGALEPRIQAHFLVALFKDTSLLDAINFGDVYSGVAREVWPDIFAGWSADAVKEHKLRGEAKIVLLAKAYGKGVRGMALQLKKSFWETKEIVDRIEHTFPGMVRFQKYMAEYAREYRGVHTLLGRFRPLPDIHSSERGKRAAAERQAMNTPIQGTAAEVVTSARLQLAPLVRLVLEIHDELIVESRAEQAVDELEIVRQKMQNPFPNKPGILKVPLVVEAKIGNTWQEAK